MSNGSSSRYSQHRAPSQQRHQREMQQQQQQQQQQREEDDEPVDLHELAKGWKAAINRATNPKTR